METIKKASYEGYIWYSDATCPKVLNDEEFSADLDATKNPFIIEGQLWNKATSESIAIKFADGKYYVDRKTVTDDEIDENDVETYIAHRMDNVAGLRFLRIWKAMNDEVCNNFEVLEPEGLVFIGFKQK